MRRSLTTITEINGFKIIRTKELVDRSTSSGIRKSQYKLLVKHNGRKIKSSYFSNKIDRNTSYRMCIKLIEVLGDNSFEPNEPGGIS